MQSAPKLLVVSGPEQGAEYQMLGPEIMIGRKNSCTIRLRDLAISREHCVIRREDSDFVLEDLGSHNGTFVNGVTVRRQRLCHADQIAVGASLFVFLSEGDGSDVLLVEEALTQGSTLRLATRPGRGLPGALVEARLACDAVSLIQIGRALFASRNSAEAEREFLTRLLDVIPADCAALAWHRPEIEEGYEVHMEGSARVPVSRAILDDVFASSDAVLDSTARRIGAQAVEATLAVPLCGADEVAGVVYLCSSTPGRRFDEHELALLYGIAQVAAPALVSLRQLSSVIDENRRLRTELRTRHAMVGESAPMREMYDRIGRVAPRDTTVLVTGESGTGKELAARAIHSGSPRASKPFIAINCATLTENLLESELFGHERGAFTGAVTQKKGKIELAEHGTVFLDEIGELAPALQAKLLRVLQEREYERVGGTRTLKANIRLIAATNRNLEEEIAAGRFREDLFYRINVVSLRMPPLRERGDDIHLLATWFVTQHAQHCGRRVGGITPEARRILETYEWPGNVRELANAMERAVVLGCAEAILPQDLPENIVEFSPGIGNEYLAGVADARRRAVLSAFRKTNGRFTEAARILDMHPNYLHRLVNKLGLRDTLRELFPNPPA